MILQGSFWFSLSIYIVYKYNMNVYVCPQVINYYSSWLRQLLHEQSSWPFLQDGMAVYFINAIFVT